MEAWRTFIIAQSKNGFVSGAALEAAGERFGRSRREMEILSLQAGIIPQRYERNIGTITIEQQIRLLKSKCLIVGLGGLGGYILEELGRLGIGAITAIDPDVFQESNLNRQLLANVETIGLPKVQAAQERLAEVNPAVDFIGKQVALSADNAAALVEGADVVIDALDNFEARRALLKVCAQTQAPLVGGSIAGWYGMVYYCFQPSLAMETAFAGLHGDRGVENELGNPAFIPALVASLESAFACRILIGDIVKQTTGKVFFVDAFNMSLESFEL